VLVSSKREIGKDEMFGIAKSVHKLNGAVRVRVRNLVQQSFPSFAM
jgi:F-type H+-transporting ATPase subunit delta